VRTPPPEPFTPAEVAHVSEIHGKLSALLAESDGHLKPRDALVACYYALGATVGTNCPTHMVQDLLQEAIEAVLMGINDSLIQRKLEMVGVVVAMSRGDFTETLRKAAADAANSVLRGVPTVPHDQAH